MDESERGALRLIVYFAARHETTAWALMDKAWVADGPSANEFILLNALRHIPQERADIVETLLSMRWIADGVSDSALEAFRRMSEISRTDADAAARVADMPFLQTLERSDMAALGSMSRLDADQLANILSHPMLKGSITDDETPIVSLLSDMFWRTPNPVDTLRDPVATLERRTVRLPLAGEVELAIFRTRQGLSGSMDLLENAVREAENLMGKPLPFTRYVGVVYDESASDFGTHFATYIGIHPTYEADTHLLAHEVAHYYWRDFNSDWIHEGMAELMVLAIENRRVGTPVKVTRRPCRYARSIKELEEIAPERGEPAFSCNYSLGEGLFVSLLRALGEDDFWEGARRLYYGARSDSYWDRDSSQYVAPVVRDSDLDIEDVRQAFGPEASEVIARWYGD